MSATITYTIAETRFNPSDNGIVLSVALNMIAKETGKKAWSQSFCTVLPDITRDDAKFTDINSLSGTALETKLINFAKNNWGYPENAVPTISAMETYAKTEASNQGEE